MSVTVRSLTVSQGTIDLTETPHVVEEDFTIQADGKLAAMGGVSITVQGDLEWVGDPVARLSAEGDTTWTLSVTGSAVMRNVKLKNCDASGGSTVDATDNCLDDGGNVNINFGPYVTPPSCTASILDTSTVRVQWTPNADPAASGWELERTVDSGTSWTPIATGNMSSAQYDDSTIVGGNAYQYRVRLTGPPRPRKDKLSTLSS